MTRIAFQTTIHLEMEVCVKSDEYLQQEARNEINGAQVRVLTLQYMQDVSRRGRKMRHS